MFQFTAQQGQTYQIETEQCVSSGDGPVCLEDTAMHAGRMVSVIAENDDDERVSAADSTPSGRAQRRACTLSPCARSRATSGRSRRA